MENPCDVGKNIHEGENQEQFPQKLYKTLLSLVK